MDSEADASIGNEECKQSNINWKNAEVSAIIDIWANVETQGSWMEYVETREFSNASLKKWRRVGSRVLSSSAEINYKLKHKYKRVISFHREKCPAPFCVHVVQIT